MEESYKVIKWKSYKVKEEERKENVECRTPLCQGSEVLGEKEIGVQYLFVSHLFFPGSIFIEYSVYSSRILFCF